MIDRVFPELEPLSEHLVDEGDAEAGEDHLGGCAALLADDQHVGEAVPSG